MPSQLALPYECPSHYGIYYKLYSGFVNRYSNGPNCEADSESVASSQSSGFLTNGQYSGGVPPESDSKA